jgi:hypothetical protein
MLYVFVGPVLVTAELSKLQYGTTNDRLCGLVVRVSGYRSRGPESDSRLYQIV